MNLLGNILNKSGRDKILILLLVGIIMLVISIPTSKSNDSDGLYSGYAIETDNEESELESKLKRCLSKVNGVGNVDVIVTYESDGKTARGVIIVAEGGDDGVIVTQITSAIESLLGIPAHKIKVLKMM